MIINNQISKSEEKAIFDYWNLYIGGMVQEDLGVFDFDSDETGNYILTSILVDFDKQTVFTNILMPKRFDGKYSLEDIHDLSEAFGDYISEHITDNREGYIIFANDAKCDDEVRSFLGYLITIDDSEMPIEEDSELLTSMIDVFHDACSEVVLKYLEEETKRMKCAS